jgi:hypothetical protein
MYKGGSSIGRTILARVGRTREGAGGKPRETVSEMSFPRSQIQKLSPYCCLFLIAAPLAVVEPLKLAAVFICGSGHWMTGSVVILCAYAVSILVVDRLFEIVKPKLLTLSWFATLWSHFIKARKKAFRWWPTTRA